MNVEAPFLPADLNELAEFLDRAEAVVAMEWIYDGTQGQDVIGLRHDVDNEIESAVRMAEWEHERGYEATYFVLHTELYWHDKDLLRRSLERIAECGHEIGLHLNAITAAIHTGRDPVQIAAEAVGELRSYGYRVRGVVAHGDPACYQHNFVNDEIFTESARPAYGAPDRVVGGVPLRPVSRAALGFEYDPNWLPRGDYLSDSGGRWSQPFSEVAHLFPGLGQLHMLIHPCWWNQALTREVAVRG